MEREKEKEEGKVGRIEEEEEVEIENLEKADLNVFMIQDGEVGQGGEDLV